MCAYIVVHNCR